MNWKCSLIALLSLSCLGFGKDPSVSIDLKDPTFTPNTMHTEKGGIVSSDDFWMQGQKIHYERSTTPSSKVSKLTAQDQLRLSYHGHTFIGKSIEYDFVTKTGMITNGRTQSGIFYISGKQILLKPDGTFEITKATLTSCEQRGRGWRIKANRLTINPQDDVRAKDVSFHVQELPVFWLPRLRATLQTLAQSPFEFEAAIRSLGGPRLTGKYLLYANNNTQARLRLDYRLSRGFGGGLELNYQGKHTSFLSRSYIAKDRLIDDPQNQHRYRIEGEFKNTTSHKRYFTYFSYDKLSDAEMASDYPRDTFNEQNPKPTAIYTGIRTYPFTILASSNLRWNQFQTLKEELPTITVDMVPLGLTSKGPFFQSTQTLSYLNYRYATVWHDILPNYSSLRLFFHPRVFAPFHLGPILFNPEIAYRGILYNDSPLDQSVFLGLTRLQLRSEIPLYKKYPSWWHCIAPYAELKHYTRPTVDLAEHYVFDTLEGYTELTSLQLGVYQKFFAKNPSHPDQLYIDLFAQGFWNSAAFTKRYPRLGANLHWQRANLFFQTRAIFNMKHHLIDRVDFHLQWTASENFAFSMEFQHRSLFNWRKADYNSFFLETLRSEEELLASPLSAKSNTIVTHIFYRLNPIWSADIATRHGWNRTNGYAFNDFKINLIRFLSCNLKWKFSIEHTRAVKVKAMVHITLDKKPHLPKFRLGELEPTF